MQETNKQLEFVLLKILDLDVGNQKARVALCKIYLEQGRIKEAKKLLNLALGDDIWYLFKLIDFIRKLIYNIRRNKSIE